MTELMVSVFLVTFILAGALMFFATYQHLFRRERLKTAAMQNARASANSMIREMRNAGYGVPVNGSELDDWVSWISGVTNCVSIIAPSVTGEKDRLVIVTPDFASATTLVFDQSSGSTSLRLAENGGLIEPYTNTLISINGEQLVRVTAVGNPDTSVTISSSPSQAGQGLKTSVSAGDAVIPIKVVSYQCSDDHESYFGEPFIERFESGPARTTANFWDRYASGVEDMDLSFDGNVVSIDLVGRAPEYDPIYVDEDYDDAYRRITVSRTVYVRNLGM